MRILATPFHTLTKEVRMRIAALLLFLTCGAAFADPVTSTALNDQVNSGVVNGTSQQQNFQINQNNNARETYGGGVSCAIPSLNFGVVGGDGYKAIATASINIPLSNKACSKSRDAIRSMMEYDLYVKKVRTTQEEIRHQFDVARFCLEMDGKLSIQADTPLAKECAKYSAASL